MPFNPNTGQWEYINSSQGFDQHPGLRSPQPPTTPPGAYNNPWYDSQLIGQQAQGGSFQPMPSTPQQPDYTGGGGMDYTNPPYNADRFGSGGSGGFGSFNPQGIGATTMPVDPMGQGAGNLDRFGGLNRAGVGPGSANFNGQPVSLYPPSQGMQTPTPVPMPGQATATAVNPDAAYPKYDPAFLSQIQSALESRTGPYAGRQPGDYGPTGAPDFVLNPQTQDDWIKRFYFFAANPGALDNPTAPRQAQAAQGPTVPWQQFAKDVYSDANANRSFNELSGVVDDARLKQAQDVFGWQYGPKGIASNDEAIALATQMKSGNPGFSYQIYKGVDGSYGIAARELDATAQESRGFISPATAARLAAERAAAMQNPHPVGNTYGGGSKKTSYGGGGNGYTTPKPVPTAPAPAPTPAAGIDTRMVGGSVNMGHPVEGQIVNYNGQMVQFRQGKWVPLAYQGGSQQHAVPV
jgi:hypothetical protein